MYRLTIITKEVDQALEIKLVSRKSVLEIKEQANAAGYDTVLEETRAVLTPAEKEAAKVAKEKASAEKAKAALDAKVAQEKANAAKTR